LNSSSVFKDPDLVLITSSTGGPSALEKVLTKIDKNIKKPVLVVQHMPVGFTKRLAEAFDKKCTIEVSEASDNELITNNIYIAKGGYHMIIYGNYPNYRTRLIQTSTVNGVMPAADVLFESVAKICKNRKVLVVVLTGMGSDGKNGVSILKESCKTYCITQSEKSCIVYGMPKSVYEAGLSDIVLDLDKIAEKINSICI